MAEDCFLIVIYLHRYVWYILRGSEILYYIIDLLHHMKFIFTLLNASLYCAEFFGQMYFFINFSFNKFTDTS